MADAHQGRTVTPPPQPPTLKDTPARARSVHSSEYRGASLVDKRNALLRELDRILPEYDIKLFLKMLPETDIEFDDITNELLDYNVITEVQPDAGRSSDGKKFKLAHFLEDPKDCTETENDVFERLNVDIFENLIAAVKQKYPEARQTTHLKTEPNTAPESDRKSRTRPDAHFVPEAKANDKKCNWTDISCTGEFKKSDGVEARDDNVTKMVYNLHHTMSIDPCRRFAIGFTIENTRMRLWFLSRSVLAISTSFDFIKDPKTFINFFLSMTYAEKSALGWDETMTRVEGEYWLYEIRHGNMTYRVLEVLADYGADVLTGRGTRVYKVQPVTETGKVGDICVLKDVWINDDRKTEHEIYDEILKSVTDAVEKDFLEKHLLKPDVSWMVDVNGEEDHTVKVMMHDISTETSKFFRLVSKEEGDYDPERESAAPVMSFDKELDEKERLATRGPPRPISKVAGRKHYRIVFKQVATPIWQLTNLSNVFHVLSDSAKVLKILAKHKWVHRDISAGNVYNHNGDGLLGDLEYAKQIGEGGGHEVLTGTLDFMAAEVLGQRYMVPSEMVVDDKSDTEGKHGSENVDELDVWADEPDNVIDTPDFTHNPGHDVESVFWLAVFMLFFNRDVSDLEESKEDKADRSACLEYVFSDKIPVSALNRYTILAQPAEFKQRVRWFCKSFKLLIHPLFSLIQAMFIAYTKFEGSIGQKKDTDIFLAAHEKAIAMFYKCEMRSRDITIVSYKSRARVVQQVHQPQPEQQADSQRLPESKPDYQQPPGPNASERPPKRKFAPSYVIENTPKYSDKKLCLDRKK